MVALDYGNGTAYAGLLMLEGAMPREAITTCAATVNSSDRLDAVLRGEVEATVLQEPWITIAEKKGCRARVDHVLPRHLGRRSKRDRRDVRRLRARSHAGGATHQCGQAPVRVLLHRRFPGHPDVEKLTPDDFDLGRIQLKEPGTDSRAEARWAWEWMASWGVLEGAFDPRAQINTTVEREAHARAAVGLRA